jgi:acyl carrier protein
LTNGCAGTREACFTQAKQQSEISAMKRAAVRAAVHRFIRRLLENRDFNEHTSLVQLGLEKADIEDLIFHLEDEFGLTAFTAEEDRMLKTAKTADDLSRFLLEIGRH